jgi:tetratricopeptide (TPR) repeat protein
MQVRQDDEAGADHLHLARQIVDSPRFSLVMRITPDLKEQQTRFRRDIYLGVLWTLQADHSNDRLVTHLQRLLDEFPDDADVMLAFGSFEEYQSSGPVVRELRPPTAVMAAGPWRRNMQERQLKRAERYYRDALKLKPSLHEARLRLGRVLQLRGLLSEAQAELLASLEPGSPATIRYLASMFLADVLDAQGNGAAALARVRDVVTRFPGCQSSHLALSRIHESRGDRAAALAALEPLWKEQPARDCVDPWWGYHLGQIWRVLALVDSLHARVRDAR